MKSVPGKGASETSTGASGRGQGTRERLLDAAEAEFEGAGYSGTHSNAIARRAGFAPQTFYRHFTDKLEVFIAVYTRWSEREGTLLARAATPEAAAGIVIAHHRTHRVFRRDLRRLTVEDARMGAIRAQAREAQMAALAARYPGFSALPKGERAAALLTVERLADALVDGEFEALGVGEAEACRAVVAALARLMAAAAS